MSDTNEQKEEFNLPQAPQLKKKQSSKLKLSKKQSKMSSVSNGDYDDDYADYDDDGDDYDDYDDYEDDDHDDQTFAKPSQNGPNIIKDTEVFERLKQKVKDDIIELTNLDFDKSLIIFKHYMFNQDKFTTNYFNDVDTILSKYGLQMGEAKPVESELECLICFDDEAGGIQLPCGNSYCYNCVASHIQSKVNNKQVFFGCMEEDCKYYFQHSLILDVLTKTKLDKDYKLYFTNLNRVYAEECKGIKWCPGTDCEYCIEDEDCQFQNVECHNGHKFCFKCRHLGWHKPCPCKFLEEWISKNSQQTLDMKWIEANTKKCPHCNRMIQRSLGCDFMRCAPPGGCGQAFCYVCLKKITESQHMEHASCKLKAEKDNSMNAKNYLEKVSMYFDNVKTCQVVQDKAREIMKNSLDEKRGILYNKGGVSLQESKFLVEAFEILIDSRDALKYSYIFAFQQFQLEGTMPNSQNLFEDFQNIYKTHCESLASSLEMSLNQFIESIANFQDAHTHGLQEPTKMQEFFELKQRITSQAQAINKSKLCMIEAVENGEIYVQESNTKGYQ